MKKLFLFAVLIVLCLGSGSAFATCPTPWTGVFASGSYNWYVYSQDASCYSLSGNTSSDTVGCSLVPGWRFGAGWSDISAASFTIGANDPILDPTKWYAQSFIEFNSPTSSGFDQVELDALVYHPGTGSTTTYQLFLWNGTQGTLSGCAYQGGYFTANTGDTVTIQVKAKNTRVATIRSSVPRIFNLNT